MNLSSINGVTKTFSDSDQSMENTPTYKKRKRAIKKRFKGLGFLVALLGLFFLVNWWMLFRLSSNSLNNSKTSVVIKV